MDYQAITQTALTSLTRIGLQILGAIVLWIVGRMLIAFALRLISKGFQRQKVDPTVASYIRSGSAVLLNIALVVAILGFFGVETTTFAALLAAGGVAIGVAWGGLLANFAAGAFLLVLRPFRVGDFVCAGGVTGTIEEIGLFTTVLKTPDNIKTIVGNSKIFGDTIQNFSATPYRRVDLLAQLGHDADHNRAIRLLQERVAKIANVLETPAPDIAILQFSAAGPVLAVRPYCKNDDYWQVYFDTNRIIRETLTEAGFPVPETPYVMRTLAAGVGAGR